MTMEVIMEYFARYGGIGIFVIVLLEYLNLPGFPSNYAACGYLGGERTDSFYTGFDYHGGGGAHRKPYFVLAGI